MADLLPILPLLPYSHLFFHVPVVCCLEGKVSLCSVPNAQESRSPVKDLSAFIILPLYLNILSVCCGHLPAE